MGMERWKDSSCMDQPLSRDGHGVPSPHGAVLSVRPNASGWDKQTGIGVVTF